MQSEARFEQLGARILKIEASQLWIERDQVHKTTYKVQNGGADAAHVLREASALARGSTLPAPAGHRRQRRNGQRAGAPRRETVRQGRARRRRAHPFQEPIGWIDDLAAIAVKAYLADPRSDQKVVAQLGPAWVIRDKLRALSDERNSLTTEQADLQRNTQETRASLKAIEKNAAAGDLRGKLTERLRRDTDRLDAITKRLIEIDLANREQEVRFRDAIRDIDLVAPPPPKD